MLEKLIVEFSQLVIEQKWIKEIDINPLLVSTEGMVALDARVILHPADLRESDIPKPAIRPYPTKYITKINIDQDTPIVLRPIRPEDEPMMIEFHRTLSEDSIWQRYFNIMKLDIRIAHERLIRRCFNDFDRDIALVAEHQDKNTGQISIVGVARLSRSPGKTCDAEFAVILSDAFQRRGLGYELLKLLVKIGKSENIQHIYGIILPNNQAMQAISEKLGFELQKDREKNLTVATLNY